MSDSNISETLANPFMLNELKQFQSGMINQWFQSLSQLFALSDITWRGMTRQQTDALSLYISSLQQKPLDALQTRVKDNPPVTTGVAVITGGIGGIGTDICKRIADEGNKIISTYIPVEKDSALAWQNERRKEGYDIDLIECDVTDFAACKRTAAEVEEKYGAVDILVNCAGITRDAVFTKMEPANWHAVLDTNLDSVFNVTRSFVNGMIKRNYGRIINISSVNGQKGQFGQTNYSAAKAGMIGFTRSLALELATSGITVNCVCPGYVHTSMVEQMREDIRTAIIGQIPMGRLAKTSEIAAAVAFLAGRENAYITGTEIAVNGGLWLG